MNFIFLVTGIQHSIKTETPHYLRPPSQDEEHVIYYFDLSSTSNNRVSPIKIVRGQTIVKSETKVQPENNHDGRRSRNIQY